MTWKGGFDGKCLSQDDFKKYVAGLKWGAWRASFMVLHNTGAPTLKQWLSTPGGEKARIANLQHYYRDQEGWSGGPHLFASPNGIFLGTPLTMPGVHTPSWNAISWGLEMPGDYDVEDFDPRVRDNAAFAIAILYAALGRDPATLRLHHEDVHTTHRHCPGKHVDKADMIARIGRAMADLHPGGNACCVASKVKAKTKAVA